MSKQNCSKNVITNRPHILIDNKICIRATGITFAVKEARHLVVDKKLYSKSRTFARNPWISPGSPRIFAQLQDYCWDHRTFSRVPRIFARNP